MVYHDRNNTGRLGCWLHQCVLRNTLAESKTVVSTSRDDPVEPHRQKKRKRGREIDSESRVFIENWYRVIPGNRNWQIETADWNLDLRLDIWVKKLYARIEILLRNWLAGSRSKTVVSISRDDPVVGIPGVSFFLSLSRAALSLSLTLSVPRQSLSARAPSVFPGPVIFQFSLIFPLWE